MFLSAKAEIAVKTRQVFLHTRFVFRLVVRVDGRGGAEICSGLPEIALVLVRLDHVASIIVNADHGIV